MTQSPPETTAARTTAQRVLLFVGSLSYVGFVPFASGTVAVAVVGVPLYLLLALWLKIGVGPYIGFTVVFTAVSIYVADRTDRILNEKDSKKNVIDEIPGFLVAMIAVPCTWQLVGAAFFLERAIDIAKIWPANLIERKLPGGWGVVLDDIVAGLYTLAILHAAVRFAPDWLVGLGS